MHALSAGSLLKLTMNGNQLRHLPPEMGQLRNLRELHVQGNQLTELPADLYQLTVSHLSSDSHKHVRKAVHTTLHSSN